MEHHFISPLCASTTWNSWIRSRFVAWLSSIRSVSPRVPTVDNHTTYCFGLDDQEFVVAFDTDDAGAFLDLVQRLRTTEASAYTKRDTPTFTCVSTTVERALSALDGEAIPTFEAATT